MLSASAAVNKIWPSRKRRPTGIFRNRRHRQSVCRETCNSRISSAADQYSLDSISLGMAQNSVRGYSTRVQIPPIIGWFVAKRQPPLHGVTRRPTKGRDSRPFLAFSRALREIGAQSVPLKQCVELRFRWCALIVGPQSGLADSQHLQAATYLLHSRSPRKAGIDKPLFEEQNLPGAGILVLENIHGQPRKVDLDTRLKLWKRRAKEVVVQEKRQFSGA